MKNLLELMQQLDEYVLSQYGGECPNPWGTDPDGGLIRPLTALADILNYAKYVDVIDSSEIHRITNKAFNENGPVEEND